LRLLGHQDSGANQLSEVGSGILADEMGLGKTRTSVETLVRAQVQRALFIAPKEIARNLHEEIRKWTRIPVLPLNARNIADRLIQIDTIGGFDRFICIANLESWRHTQTLIEALNQLRLDALVIDEAHHINNPETSAYRGARELRYGINQCPKCKATYSAEYLCTRKNCKLRGTYSRFHHCFGCGFPARRVGVPPCRECGFDVRTDLANASSVRFFLAMTGRPFVNSASDIWTMLHLVDRTDFPSKKDYVKQYCTTDPNGKHWFKPDGESALLTRLGPRFLRRSMKDAGIELPPQAIEVLEYDIDDKVYPEQYRVYRQIEQHYAMRLDDQTISIPEVITQIMRLRQAIIWPAGIVIRDPETKEIIAKCEVEESQKLDIVERLIRESLEENARIVCFSHFRSPLRELHRRLGDISVVYDGATTDAQRAAIRADFAPDTREPKWSVALCNYRSAGEGLTFTGASRTVLCDEEWSPAKSDQAFGRTHRIGQQHKTFVRIPRITQTVDDWMAGIIQSKAVMNEGFQHAIDMIRERLNGNQRIE
jgi:SNF2 family DNA or RNA helicase